MEQYKDGTGRVIFVHDKANCKGPYCCIHNPSSHHMRGWPTLWRDDRYLMERVCPHGIGHPDPDHLAYLPTNVAYTEGVHGCDGCCIERDKTVATSVENQQEGGM